MFLQVVFAMLLSATMSAASQTYLTQYQYSASDADGLVYDSLNSAISVPVDVCVGGTVEGSPHSSKNNCSGMIYYDTADCTGDVSSFSQMFNDTNGASKVLECNNNPKFLSWPGYVSFLLTTDTEDLSTCPDNSVSVIGAWNSACIVYSGAYSAKAVVVSDTITYEIFEGTTCSGTYADIQVFYIGLDKCSPSGLQNQVKESQTPSELNLLSMSKLTEIQDVLSINLDSDSSYTWGSAKVSNIPYVESYTNGVLSSSTMSILGVAGVIVSSLLVIFI